MDLPRMRLDLAPLKQLLWQCYWKILCPVEGSIPVSSLRMISGYCLRCHTSHDVCVGATVSASINLEGKEPILRVAEYLGSIYFVLCNRINMISIGNLF